MPALSDAHTDQPFGAWTDEPLRAAPADGAVVLQQAIARHPDNGRLRVMLGIEQRDAGDHAAALELFQQAVRLDPSLRAAWAGAGFCLRKLGRLDELLAWCEGAWAGDAAGRAFERGRALIRLGRVGAGQEALREAARGEYPRTQALRTLLESLARAGDAPAIIEACDLEPRQCDLALVRGYRALAFSMLGRVDAARAIVDLERCVMRYRFDPPAALGGVDAVNQRLGDAILADPPAAVAEQGTALNYRPRLPANADVGALRDFIRSSMRDYLARTDTLGAAAMPDVPHAASLSFGTVVLRHSGRNRQHLHPIGYLSSVYHVRVPPAATGEDPDRGALVLGPCDELAGGHRACWGTRHVAAAEGWLTIFPSHIFHDVVPTQSGDPRISIISDLNPRRGTLIAPEEMDADR